MNRFEEMYEGSWYTITGAGGDINEWKQGYERLMIKEGIGTPKEWVSFKGKDMNDYYGLVGSVAYLDDLTFLAFPLTDLEQGKLIYFKLRMGDRWFDDIVDNNRFVMSKNDIEEEEDY